MNTSQHKTDIASLAHWFELSPDAMLLVAGDGTILLANALAETMFGYAPGTLAGREVEALVPAYLRETHRAHRAAYMAAPRTLAVKSERELAGERANGERFPLGISLAPVATEHGTCVIVSVRDISATWRAHLVSERARRDAIAMQIGRLAVASPDYERALKAVPALVADALDVATVAIFATDWRRRDPYIRAAIGLSDDAARMLTSSFGEVLLLRSTFIDGGPDAITCEQLCEPRYAKIRENLAAAGFHDVAIVPLSGRDEPLGAIAALAGKTTSFDRSKIEFLRATANLLAAAAQRNRTEEQLTHAHRLEAIGQLTGGVAHDFNNLLTVISGNLQLLEAGTPPDSENAEIIASAARAVDRGASLTHRLLAFARRQPLAPRAVVPKPLLDELAHMLRRTLGEPISITVDCAVDVPDVYADVNELDTALVNLAINARDAMPRGGRLALTAHAVTLAGHDEEWGLPAAEYVSFVVQDTGTGMTPETQARALEPFFTTKSARKGSGLGLSMVYGFVNQSGGAMRLDSRLGYGTRVELLLPVAPASARPEIASVHPEPGATPATTILVVEDEPDVRTIATRFLAALGYRVLAAADAQAALDILAAHPEVALLFSDVVLGSGANGIELARAAQARMPTLQVLLTSGYEGDGMPDRAAGGYPLLRKPYRREQLEGAVRDAIKRS